ncbi:Gluconate transport-inducing protein [Pleosporales sp. CAS-2024a]
METYHGLVRTPADAIILFEACRTGLLPRVQRRLSQKERQQIRSGSVFVWDEREVYMRRWTDGIGWSASRVSGSFLTYREMEGKRGGRALPAGAPAKRPSGKSPEGAASAASADGDGEGPQCYRYKPDGLMKQTYTVSWKIKPQNDADADADSDAKDKHVPRLHLISYYSRSNSNNLRQPTKDPLLKHIVAKDVVYTECTVTKNQPLPPVMPGPGPMPASPAALEYSPYVRPVPAPPPMYAVPPLHAYYAQHPYFYGGGSIIYAQPPYHLHHHHQQQHQHQQQPPPPYHLHQQPPHVLDRPPPHMTNPLAPPGHAMLAHPPAYALHPAHPAPYLATPPPRPPFTAEQAQAQAQAQAQHLAQNAPPPPLAASVPKQGPQLPAINGAAASAAAANSLPTPEPSDKSQSQSGESTGAAAARPLPTLGSLLNGHGPAEEKQSASRSGSRTPNTASRFPRDLAPERLAKNSTAADSSALNKLNSVFIRS